MQPIDKFFSLLCGSLAPVVNETTEIASEEWSVIYQFALKQSVVGIIFDGIRRLSLRPPQYVLFQWMVLAEQIRAQNQLQCQECARLTTLFENEGHQTVILKGLANGLMYDGSLANLRQPGDIDIWVSGGKDAVVKTLRKLHLLNGELSSYEGQGTASQSYHHIDLPKDEKGIEVEVHFRPSSGNKNPFTNRRLQKFLNDEFAKGNLMVAEGFRVPSIRFALVMQLSHIQRHLMSRGIGLRQIVDYYFLLKQAHKENTNVTDYKDLRTMGLGHIAGAVMWVLHEKLRLEDQYLIAPMDERRGRMLLDVIMEGGNFGHHYDGSKVRSLTRKALDKHLWRLRFLYFDVPELIWREVRFVGYFLKSMPERMRKRSLSLGKLI